MTGKIIENGCGNAIVTGSGGRYRTAKATLFAAQGARSWSRYRREGCTPIAQVVVEQSRRRR